MSLEARENQNFLLNETPGNGGHQIAPSEEEAMLRARIDRMLDTIVCPPSYGAWQAKKDRYLRDSHYKDPRSAAEDAEHAQLTARVLAFSRTPEGRARDRIAELGWKRFESLETVRNGLRRRRTKANLITCRRSTRICPWIPTTSWTKC